MTTKRWWVSLTRRLSALLARAFEDYDEDASGWGTGRSRGRLTAMTSRESRSKKEQRVGARVWGQRAIQHINASLHPVFEGDERLYEGLAVSAARAAGRLANRVLGEVADAS